MTLGAMDSQVLSSVMLAFRDAIVAHEATINALNVFPVPDGDTGTNMRATLDSVAKALASRDASHDANGVLKAIAEGSLLGARGNSGLILSQYLRGFVSALAQCTTYQGGDVGRALVVASTHARSAISDPIEGTVLSVASAAASAAERAMSVDGDLLAVVNGAYTSSLDALARTPTQLAVLADAGVVDAGGAGLTLFFGALVRACSESIDPITLVLTDEVNAALADAPRGAPAHAKVNADPASPEYEVMFFLETDGDGISRLRSTWASIGDSVVIVGQDSMWNCHIHSGDIGRAIEAGINVGRPYDIRVTDLRQQVTEESWVTSSLEALPDGREHDKSLTKRCAVVSVASGDGLRSMLYSLGVAVVIDGGALMNPSVGEILSALATIESPEIILMPNNVNAVAVAREAAKAVPQAVEIVATKDTPEAIAALVQFDANGSVETNVASMSDVLDHVVSGEIMQAVRNAHSEAGDIGIGDFVGISSSSIVAVAPTLVEATGQLVDELVRDDHEIVTLYSGAGLSDVEVTQVISALRTKNPKLVVEHHFGGQLLHPMLVLVE